MKTLELTDEQYEVLSSLVKELQTQPNWGQAFPYFWVPSSEQKVLNPNNEGEVTEVFDADNCEMMGLEECAEKFPEMWKDYLFYEKDEITEAEKEDDTYEPRAYNEKEDEVDWSSYLYQNHDELGYEYRVHSFDWERQKENNPSFFLSDVQRFCATNQHHLGRNPKPYSQTIWRMPKMEQFIKSVMELFPMEENVEPEIKLRVYKK